VSGLCYVCLSDLHLGAGYSLLTGHDEAGRTAPDRSSPVQAALGTALREMLPLLDGGERPTLVLLGDVLDMGLSPMRPVAQAFRRFVHDVVLGGGDEPLFAPRAIFVPGNHDHHLWRMAQDEALLTTLHAEQVDEDLLQHTPLFAPDDHAVSSSLLTRLLAAAPALADARVEIAYPNLGLRDATGQRCVVLHHGHYVDPMYRAMSTITSRRRPRAPGAPPPGMSVGQIEAQNGAWVDFLWSDLGSAGATGREAGTLYEIMRDGSAAHAYAQRLAGDALGLLRQLTGVSGQTPVAAGVTVDHLVRGLIDATLERGAQSQRDGYDTATTAADVADLRWYLSGAVHQQLAQALPTLADGAADPHALDLSFIYGHTHKPYEDELPVPGYAQPVAVYNTGGWVMDQPTMSLAQGASAMLIDEDLNVAALRLFKDPVNGVSAPVHVAGVGGPRDAHNPLLAAARDAVAQTSTAWQTFSDATQRMIERRAAQLLDRFFDDAHGAGGPASRDLEREGRA